MQKGITFQVLSILGEQVSFVPTKLSPGETAIVEFDRYYVPEGLSNEEKTVLRNTMKHIFSGTLKEVADAETGEELEEFERAAYPPCGEEEKELVFQSLLHRKTLLEQQLFDLGVAVNPDQLKKLLRDMRAKGQTTSSKPSTVLSEYHLNHWRKLHRFIQHYDEAEKCVKIEEISYKDVALDLSDDKIRDLLKQFVFFLLQGSHPIDEYKTKDPTATAFIKRLEKKPITPIFSTYLTTYKDKKFPIPPRISKVLEATDLDPKSMKDEIDRILKEERIIILTKIRTILPPGHPIWKTVKEPIDVAQIVDILNTKTIELENEIRRLIRELEDADRIAKVCEQARAALQAEKERVDQRLKEIETELLTLRAESHDKDRKIEDLNRQKTEVQAQYERRIAELTQKITDCEAEKTAKQAEIDRLTNENAAQRTELEELRARIAQLEELHRTTLDDLRKQHAEALAQEKSKTVSAEAARAAALASSEKATAALAQKTTELASIRAELEAANALVATKDATIADLTRRLNECEAGTARIQEDLRAKTEEIRRLHEEKAALEQQIAKLTEDLQEAKEDRNITAESTGALKEQLDEAQERIRQLEDELAAEQAKVQDLTTQLHRCQEEKGVLEASASGSVRDRAELEGRLRVAEEEKSAAQARIAELEATLKQLREQLATAEQRAATAEGTVSEQKDQLNDKDTTIGYLEKDIRDKQDELDKIEGNLQDAEGRATDCQKNLAKTIADADKRVSDVKNDLETQFKDALEATKKEFETTLKDEKAQLEESLRKAAADRLQKTQTEYEAALKEQKENYEKALGVVQRIADWIDTGTDTGISESVPVPADTLHSSALTTIVNKLGEPVPTAAAAEPSADERKRESYINLCYIVFLAAFLWQTNLPLLPDKPLEVQTEPFKRQKIIQTIIPILFNGGEIPSTIGTTSPGVAAASLLYSRFTGAYNQIQYDSASPTKLRAPYEGRAQAPNKIVQRYLNIFNKVARAMEGPAADGSILGLDSLDSQYLNVLMEKLTSLLNSFEVKFSNKTVEFSLKEGFAQLARDTLLVNQPLLKESILDMYLVKEKNTYKVVRNADKSPSQVNFAVVVYCFLVVLRDYLNTAQNTVSAQCPLPLILRKQKK